MIRLPAGDPRHGTPTGYGNWRCRCQPCRAAGAAANRKNRQRRNQRAARVMRDGSRDPAEMVLAVLTDLAGRPWAEAS